MKSIDPKAYKILKKYDLFNPQNTTAEDFAYAKQHGLMFDGQIVEHDASVRAAIATFQLCKKTAIADSFLFGLGQNIGFARSALPAYAYMMHFPMHTYIGLSEHPDPTQTTHCSICAESYEQEADFSDVNQARSTGFLSTYVHKINFYLERHLDEAVTPSTSDIDQFVAVLDFIKTCPPDEKPRTLYKKIRKLAGIKMTSEEAEYFLNALGYGGILQTPDHVGWIYKYHGYLTPSTSRSSDWAYPVDFWRGQDGINTDALKFWFSHHEKIMQWMLTYQSN